MKSILFFFIASAVAFAGDLAKFAGPQSKSGTITGSASVFSSVDPVTSALGASVGTASGTVEVLAVYSPYVKTAKGWSWIELLSIGSDNSVTPDANTEGRMGVASLAKPNELDTVIAGAALYPGEKQAVVDTWPQWVKVKSGNVTGWVYIASIKLQ